jgi:hypothetical protein
LEVADTCLRKEIEKQFCAFSAGGRFHRAWLKNGNGDRSPPKSASPIAVMFVAPKPPGASSRAACRRRPCLAKRAYWREDRNNPIGHIHLGAALALLGRSILPLRSDTTRDEFRYTTPERLGGLPTQASPAETDGVPVVPQERFRTLSDSRGLEQLGDRSPLVILATLAGSRRRTG